jgi:hypothetical protein
VLGHENAATKTTTLRDTRGTPLKLVGKKSKPPLAVNSSKQVNHLNASLLSGATAAQLVLHGSGVSTAVPKAANPTTLSNGAGASTPLATTDALSPGTYFVDATANLEVTASEAASWCYVAKTGGADGSSQNPNTFGAVDDVFGTAVEDLVVTAASSETFTEYCYSNGGTTYADAASIQAIKVASFSPGSSPLSRRPAASH